jgi:hypothetical protein
VAIFIGGVDRILTLIVKLVFSAGSGG